VTTLGDLAEADSGYASTAEGILSSVFTNAYASNGNSWLDGYYDDEGWWALAWIKAWDLTHNGKYLSAAESIFSDLTTGLGGACGGQWWDKSHTAVNSINNELFIAVAASLANRVSSKKSYYQKYAVDQYEWLFGAGLQNSENLFMDGLDTSTCAPIGAVWVGQEHI